MRDCCLDLTVMEQHSLTVTCLLVHSQIKMGVLSIIIHSVGKETVKLLLDPFYTFGVTVWKNSCYFFLLLVSAFLITCA